MYIFLSAQDIDSVDIAWIKKNGSVQIYEHLQINPEGYLDSIHHFLNSNDILFRDIRGVIVVNGPGSFTSTRIITTIANSIAFANDIIVVAVENKERKSVYELTKKIKFPLKIQKECNSRFATPVYDRPAHITQSKK